MFGVDAYCSWADDIIVSEAASLSRFRVTHASVPLTPPRMAANFAKLPGLLRRGDKGS